MRKDLMKDPQKIELIDGICGSGNYFDEDKWASTLKIIAKPADKTIISSIKKLMFALFMKILAVVSLYTPRLNF